MRTFVAELGLELSPRELAIYNGTAGLPEEKRQQYLALWKQRRDGPPPAPPNTRVGPPSPPATPESLPCAHRGGATGRTVACRKCKNLPPLDVYECRVHGACTVPNAPHTDHRTDKIQWCKYCPDRRVPDAVDLHSDPVPKESFVEPMSDVPKRISLAVISLCVNRLAMTERIGVYGCWIHGECTEHAGNGVRVCEGCPDHSPVSDPYLQTYAGLEGESRMTRGELAFLISMLPESGLVVEVGTADGVSAAMMARARSATRFVCIDPFIGWPEKMTVWRKNTSDLTNVSLWAGRLADCPIPKADVVIVDGDHEYESCRRDLDSAAKMADLIAVHDYRNDAWPGVTKAVESFRRERTEWVECGSVGLLLILKKSL